MGISRWVRSQCKELGKKWATPLANQGVDLFPVRRENPRRIMKKEKDIKELKVERPRRAVVSEKEALKRMKDFSKRKEQFLATARTGKSRGVRS